MQLRAKHQFKSNSSGFTLIEMMIVIAIIGVIAAIAVPSYKNYTVKSKRADMMAELQNIASNIESQKLAKGNYTSVSISGLTGNFPRQGTAIYNISSAPATLTKDWTLTAAPIAGGPMANDGNLKLAANGTKCRGSSCGMADEWNK